MSRSHVLPPQGILVYSSTSIDFRLFQELGLIPFDMGQPLDLLEGCPWKLEGSSGAALEISVGTWRLYLGFGLTVKFLVVPVEATHLSTQFTIYVPC